MLVTRQPLGGSTALKKLGIAAQKRVCYCLHVTGCGRENKGMVEGSRTSEQVKLIYYYYYGTQKYWLHQSLYTKFIKLNFNLTKRRQILDWHFLSGWVKGHGGDLESLVSFR